MTTPDPAGLDPICRLDTAMVSTVPGITSISAATVGAPIVYDHPGPKPGSENFFTTPAPSSPTYSALASGVIANASGSAPSDRALTTACVSGSTVTTMLGYVGSLPCTDT